MEIIEIVLLILLVVVCIALGALVLIQQGRGSDIGAAFGSGAANTIFGSSGATPFLVKFTAMLAIGFFVVTFGLAYTA
ncbi:MAG: preprotein translocase subunit SecG, partial [Gammaproteobacteria bacterium]|nr:preprotein translocase subunit SecG [Gammaproteobacteria bacterium]